ncbi:MAG: hypothetical protein WDO73_13935 [Ignavibacteriota bacterium]
MRVFRLLPLFLAAGLFAQPARHALTLDDLARFREVRDPQCSPDGQWVAYTVTTTDAKEDKHDTDVWMISIDGKHDLRLTSSPESESGPKWSPDGKYLAFTSSRPGKAKGNQGLAARSDGRRGVATHGRQGTAARLRMVARFEATRSLGPIFWLLHNWKMCGDALDFYRGPYSALAIQGNANYPGNHYWPRAFQSTDSMPGIAPVRASP